MPYYHILAYLRQGGEVKCPGSSPTTRSFWRGAPRSQGSAQRAGTLASSATFERVCVKDGWVQ